MAILAGDQEWRWLRCCEGRAKLLLVGVPPRHPLPTCLPFSLATSLPFLGLDPGLDWDDTGASGPVTVSGTPCRTLTLEDLSSPSRLLVPFPEMCRQQPAGGGRRVEPQEEALGLAGVLPPAVGGPQEPAEPQAAPPPHGHLTPLPPRLELHRHDLIQLLGPPGRWAGVEGRGEGAAQPLQK
ncbi:hypothetical protein P7K49_026650 [Saguinus oedipus]|uniref:Uncharacterized protein n=1 Tax=Saguinus oedipus TaxID=9490 RepID=A0ABQ9UDS8_SAGOE|nr:hypothetical protein P7K49_026650 [Saguinus oedipus]